MYFDENWAEVFSNMTHSVNELACEFESGYDDQDELIFAYGFLVGARCESAGYSVLADSWEYEVWQKGCHNDHSDHGPGHNRIERSESVYRIALSQGVGDDQGCITGGVENCQSDMASLNQDGRHGEIDQHQHEGRRMLHNTPVWVWWVETGMNQAPVEDRDDILIDHD